MCGADGPRALTGRKWARRHQPERSAPVDDVVDHHRDATRRVLRLGSHLLPPAGPRWEYRIEPTSDGVRLVEAVQDRRGPLLRAVSPLIAGSPDRDERNADTMETTLEGVKAAAEAERPDTTLAWHPGSQVRARPVQAHRSLLDTRRSEGS